MTIEQRKKYHEFVTSYPVMFLMHGTGFGVIMASMAKGPFSWQLALMCGVPFGLIMAYVMKRRLQNDSPGTPRSDTEWQLLDHFKKGTLPTDPELIKVFPEYIKQQELVLDQSRKALPWMIIIGAVGLLYGVNGGIAMGICGIFILGLAIFSMISINKTGKKIQLFHARLGEKLSKK